MSNKGTEIGTKIVKPIDPDKASTVSLEPAPTVPTIITVPAPPGNPNPQTVPSPEPQPQTQSRGGDIKIIIDSELKVKQLQERLGEIEAEKQEAIKRAESAEQSVQEKEETLATIKHDAHLKEVDVVMAMLPAGMEAEKVAKIKENFIEGGSEQIETFKTVLEAFPSGKTSTQPLQPRRQVPGGQSTVQGTAVSQYPADYKGYEKMAYDMDEKQTELAWKKWVNEAQKGRQDKGAEISTESLLRDRRAKKEV